MQTFQSQNQQNHFLSDYDEVVREWQNNDVKRNVEIKQVNINLEQYKKIVLITSTWWYGITPVMKKFLKEYDLTGKDVIVASSNAGWIGHCFKDYKTLLPNSNIKGKLDLVFSANAGERDKMLTSKEEVDNWIKKLQEEKMGKKVLIIILVILVIALIGGGV